MKKINVPTAFDRIAECWSPHVAARVNGQDVRLARIKGAFDWHQHDGVEEAFFVVKGRFVMRFRDRSSRRSGEHGAYAGRRRRVLDHADRNGRRAQHGRPRHRPHERRTS